MRLELLWLTNISTPYTVPVWRELSKQCEAIFACMASGEGNRSWHVDTSGIPLHILNCPSITLNYETRLYLPNWRLLRLLIKRPATIVIDGWESPAGLLTLIMGILLRCEVVISYWSTSDTHRFSGGPIAWTRKLVFMSCHKVYTPGSAARDAAIRTGASPHKILQGFPTVDTSIFNRDSRFKTASRDNSANTLIYAGQLIERKNVGALLEALAELSESNFTLLLAGDGPLRSSLESQAHALGLGERVEFLGSLQPSQLREAFERADTLILPSTEEVWGLVVNEALHAGLRVVVSERCGVAADIGGWPAVTIANTTKDGLAQAIRRASSIPKPRAGHPIDRQTPEALARLLSKSLVQRSA